MAENRVAVYLDFDNIVISRYEAVHGRARWRVDQARDHAMSPTSTNEVARRLDQARVDVDAIIDYATSFGTVAFTRAYADWSVPANAAYRPQLVNRAVYLTQLFSTSGTKNGADIRLSTDAIDDLYRHADLTHVVIVAGDSDFIALAQHCKRLGRHVVGIGVAGSTSRALVAACDEFTHYADLPGVPHPAPEAPAPDQDKPQPAQQPAKAKTRKAKPATLSPEEAAAELLVRAIRVGMEKSSDEWLYAAGVKSQMQRLDPAFKESALGFGSFRKFVESQEARVESRFAANGQAQVRLRQG